MKDRDYRYALWRIWDYSKPLIMFIGLNPSKAAWGSFKVSGRDQEVIEMFPNGKALLLNKNGTPHHPLRLRTDIKPIKFLS